MARKVAKATCDGSPAANSIEEGNNAEKQGNHQMENLQINERVFQAIEDCGTDWLPISPITRDYFRAHGYARAAADSRGTGQKFGVVQFLITGGTPDGYGSLETATLTLMSHEWTMEPIAV